MEEESEQLLKKMAGKTVSSATSEKRRWRNSQESMPVITIKFTDETEVTFLNVFYGWESYDLIAVGPEELKD